MKHLLTPQAKTSARELSIAWNNGTVEQIFTVNFAVGNVKEGKTQMRATYSSGIDKSSEIYPNLTLGAVRELSINGLITHTEAGSLYAHGGVLVEITLLQPLQNAVESLLD